MIKKCLVAAGCIVSLLINDNVVASNVNLDYATVHTVKSKNSQTLDFSRFGQAVGDKRLVLLDELTHGEGNVFDLKRQIIEYLHQHKGFDLLLLESGIYDVSQVWANDKQSIKSQAPGNIFYMYANSEAVHKLFDYVDAQRDSKRPLHLAGFDGRLSGELSINQIANQLQAFATTHYTKQTQWIDWAFFNTQTQAILKRDAKALQALTEPQRMEYMQQANFLADLMGKEQILGSGYQSSTFWAQIIKGNAMVGQQLLGLRRSDENDLIMGENIEWLLNNLYPNKKAIVWGHFVHVNRQGLGPVRYANVGTELIRRYPGQVYVAHFAGGAGHFTDFISMKKKSVPNTLDGSSASFESSLLNTSIDIGFIDKQDINFAKPSAKKATVWGYDYASTMPLTEWPKMWDGMFYLNQVTPVNWVSP